MVYKVTPKISPTHQTVSNENQDASQEVADYETALDSAGYGSFSRSALGACACAFFCSGVENCVMSYVLPAAKCELHLTTYQAGLINMGFMSGGVASAFFWGIVGDVFGRKNTLSLTLFLDAAITLAQSTIYDYRMLLAARTFNGFIIGGPATLVFPYLSDLVGVKKRQFYLNIIGMSFVVAWLVLPAIAWLVIPFKNPGHLTLLPMYSWRLYLALASLPGFITAAWVMYLPESPRLLLDTNRGDKALTLLTYIHKANKGKNSEYAIKKLIPDDMFAAKSVNGDENRTKDLFMSVLRDLKIFVSKSYAVKSSLIVFIFFANMAAGFGLNMWIPELLLRMQGRECKNAKMNKTENAAVNVSNLVWKELAKLYDTYEKPELLIEFNTTGVASREREQVCDDTIDAEVFISGLIVGACCVVGNIVCALLCARGGAQGVRRAAAACAGACALACACLAATACSCSNSNTIAVAAAAALNSASLNGNVLLIRLLLHALPAKLSGLGVCWGAWWGRAGGVVSNLAVGALLDYSCPAPFISVAALLAISIGGILIIKLEDTEKETEQNEEVDQENGTEKNVTLDKYTSTYM